MNESNLQPLPTRTKEMQREIQSKGGKAHAKKVREMKTFAEAIRLVLREKTPEGLTKQQALVAKSLANAFKKGDLKDIKTICEILGELKPEQTNNNNLVMNINASKEGADGIRQLMADKD